METATGIFDLNQIRPVTRKFKLSALGKNIRIRKELGLEPATPEEAIKILNLKGVEKTGF